jgi:ABC-type branched-subunit amino acid transport system ATPase component
MTRETSVLTVEGLETSYGQSQVLFGVDLEVRRGEVVTLLGRNGMGKTTTIRSIMGMTAPHGGSVTFEGRQLRGLTSFRIAKLGLGLVPEGRCIFPSLTVWENLTATRERDRPARRVGPPMRSSRFSLGSASADRKWAGSSRAGSSRCWRSHAR